MNPIVGCDCLRFDNSLVENFIRIFSLDKVAVFIRDTTTCELVEDAKTDRPSVPLESSQSLVDDTD